MGVNQAEKILQLKVWERRKWHKRRHYVGLKNTRTASYALTTTVFFTAVVYTALSL